MANLADVVRENSNFSLWRDMADSSTRNLLNSFQFINQRTDQALNSWVATSGMELQFAKDQYEQQEKRKQQEIENKLAQDKLLIDSHFRQAQLDYNYANLRQADNHFNTNIAQENMWKANEAAFRSVALKQKIDDNAANRDSKELIANLRLGQDKKAVLDGILSGYPISPSVTNNLINLARQDALRSSLTNDINLDGEVKTYEDLFGDSLVNHANSLRVRTAETLPPDAREQILSKKYDTTQDDFAFQSAEEPNSVEPINVELNSPSHETSYPPTEYPSPPTSPSDVDEGGGDAEWSIYPLGSTYINKALDLVSSANRSFKRVDNFNKIRNDLVNLTYQDPSLIPQVNARLRQIADKYPEVNYAIQRSVAPMEASVVDIAINNNFEIPRSSDNTQYGNLMTEYMRAGGDPIRIQRLQSEITKQAPQLKSMVDNSKDIGLQYDAYEVAKINLGAGDYSNEQKASFAIRMAQGVISNGAEKQSQAAALPSGGASLAEMTRKKEAFYTSALRNMGVPQERIDLAVREKSPSLIFNVEQPMGYEENMAEVDAEQDVTGEVIAQMATSRIEGGNERRTDVYGIEEEFGREFSGPVTVDSLRSYYNNTLFGNTKEKQAQKISDKIRSIVNTQEFRDFAERAGPEYYEEVPMEDNSGFSTSDMPSISASPTRRTTNFPKLVEESPDKYIGLVTNFLARKALGQNLKRVDF